MDRLIEAIRRTGNPSVVGLDPKPGLLPKQLLETVAGLDDLAQAYLVFNQAIIDSVSDLIPAVKPQIAMYEALGPAGVDVYARTCAYAQSKGLYVLGDVKRGTSVPPPRPTPPICPGARPCPACLPRMSGMRMR